MPNTTRIESLGPAERIIQTLTRFSDHAVHNRPGIVIPDSSQKQIGVVWHPATWVQEGDAKVVYKLSKIGNRRSRVKVGILTENSEVKNGNLTVGRWQLPGLFPEVVKYLYQQIAEVWKLDNEFAARWASYTYNNDENRDLNVLLAAFMLVQNRFGELIRESGESFKDDDFREVGEAMCLLRNKNKGFTPKLLLRVGEVLELPEVININRDLGFGRTHRNIIKGRYYKVIEKWLRHLEQNPYILSALVSKGYRTTVMKLCRKVKFKPVDGNFFQILRWKQKQSKDGHRTVAIGESVKPADTWEGLTEPQICERIESSKLGWKVIAGKLPKEIGITPAILAASIESGALSDQDLIILTPTLEALGLVDKDGPIKDRWKAAMDKAKDQRAANVAKNVRSKKVKEVLEEASDKATAKALKEVTKDFRIYVFVDISSSMNRALENAKEYITKFVGAFPLERLHVAVFNTIGREVKIKSSTAAGVRNAFKNFRAGGGTSYAAGVNELIKKYAPNLDEEALFLFIGDQEDLGMDKLVKVIKSLSWAPSAFGILHVSSSDWISRDIRIVEKVAKLLGIPCFPIDEKIFSDPYAVSRTLRNIIKATPVTEPVNVKRENLIDKILNTPLLQKPIWV